MVQLVGPVHVSIALDYVFDTQELEEQVQQMKDTFPPGLGYDQSPRFVPPEQLEEIVSTLHGWGYGEGPLKALLGGNLLRLARQVELVVIMRVYFEKRRTTAGSKGYINDPHFCYLHDLAAPD